MRLFRSKTQSPERRTLSPLDQEIETRQVRQRRSDFLTAGVLLTGIALTGIYLGVTCYQEGIHPSFSRSLDSPSTVSQVLSSGSEKELTTDGQFCSDSRVLKQTLRKGEYLNLGLILFKVVDLTDTHVLIQNIGDATPIPLVLDGSNNVVTSFCCSAEKTGKDAVTFSVFHVLSIEP